MTGTHFKDYFSCASDDYRKFRPTYPAVLFDYLAATTRENERAWDCATGSGQAALQLAQRYRRVIASDASAQQIENTLAADNIEYRVMPAEHTDIAPRSVDLVTVAQALHWFDPEKFFAECRRVLKPGGLLAVWSYNLLTIDEATDDIINHLYSSTLGKYWPEERRQVENAYGDVDFPFPLLSGPEFQMRTRWTLEQLLGYLGTWSAYLIYKEQTGRDPLIEIHESLRAAWGNPLRQKTIKWPLSLLLGHSDN